MVNSKSTVMREPRKPEELIAAADLDDATLIEEFVRKRSTNSVGQGFAAAQNNLGVCYRDGTGVTKDLKQAVQWFRSGAEQGLAAAQNNLGVRYYKGEGVMTNFTEAVNWYRKASEQRLPDAFVNLGICYVDGSGVPRDMIKAYIYFEVAAAQGDTYAPQIRQFLEKQMTPREIAEGQRRSFAFISGSVGDPANRILP
jgi:TPR repeat protein